MNYLTSYQILPCPGCNSPSLSLCFTYEPGFVHVHCLNPHCYIDYFDKVSNLQTQ